MKHHGYLRFKDGYMKIFFFMLGAIISVTNCFAQQGRLTGHLVDENNNAVKFANVRLIKPGSEKINHLTTLTDSSGNFILSSPDTGNYQLEFSAIGFTVQRTDIFLSEGNMMVKNFGKVKLKTEAKMLKDISVTALRPTIIQEADRIVVTIEGTAMAAGNTAFTVLSKAPGVFIDHEGNIQLNGKAGVTVMLDGRLTYLSAKDLRELLESMSAENIKKIELIANPSAKYDAEGTAGMINIVFKKNVIQGIKGSINAAYTYNFWQHLYSAGGNLQIKRGKWNSFLNIDFSRRAGGRQATFTRIFFDTSKTTYFDQNATGNYSVVGPPSLRLGTDVDITSKHAIGMIFNFVTNTAHSDFLTDTYIGNSATNPTQYIDANNYNSNTYRSFSTNLHYTFKVDTLGTTLSTDLDYADISNKGEGNYYNTFHNLVNDDKTKNDLYTSTPNGYKVRSGKIDLTWPYIKKYKLEFGIKASNVTSENDSRFYFNNTGLVPDPQRTNYFFYRENIYAAYLNWSGSLNKRFTFQAGLRLENTNSTGKLVTTGQVTKRNYLDIFPSLFVQQKVTENYGINYNYSRRLSRPNYGNLNPFRAYRDPYTWTEGNPYLRPQYTNSITVTQTIMKQYIIQLNYQATKDVMSEIPILDVASTTTIYTTGNVSKGRSAGFTGIAPVKILKKWDTRNTLQLTYSKYNTTSNVGALENDQLFFLVESAHTFLLPKDLRVEMSFFYRGPAASGLYHMGPMNWVDLAVKKSFYKKKLDLTLSFNDIFKGYRYRWTTDIGGNVNKFDQYFRFQTIGASLRYNFSKGLKTTERQRKSLEELDRI